jgi:NADPH-dependent 2,4-dienoyl-CoA reductase/sulfur reductase-like enzyme
VRCDDGRVVAGSHALLAIGSLPNSEGLGLEAAGVELGAGGYVSVNRHCQTNVPHIFAAGDLSGKLPLSSVASMQGRQVAEYVVRGHTASHRHPNYESAPSAIFTEPEIADVGLAEADAFAEGRKIRVTKVPFAASARALIDNDSRGFVKIVTDPATGIVLGARSWAATPRNSFRCWPWPSPGGYGWVTSSSRCWSTPPWAKPWLKPPTERATWPLVQSPEKRRPRSGSAESCSGTDTPVVPG